MEPAQKTALLKEIANTKAHLAILVDQLSEAEGDIFAGWTFRQEGVKCTKENCRCSSGKKKDLHGPYWYGYHRVNGKLKKKYIGKDLEGWKLKQYQSGPVEPTPAIPFKRRRTAKENPEENRDPNQGNPGDHSQTRNPD